ncbi:hypothetical protein PCANC_25484 [Puccinia coronata f. sp. avenae]|uniref:Uncharacterized protein n=1 Tax=Puccinia coronata f. sp. avenae TaxID=200324 RepID=A0A2N5SP88_9BASI|nr:hypothetical protein PCANC_25484 [Puccinia coronata f. sp. avenae]
MSSPEHPAEDHLSSQRLSSNLSWAKADSGDLTNKPTLAAAITLVRNTQANLNQIFGPAINANLNSDDKVDHHKAEMTVVSGHFPSSWIRPRPPTPHPSNPQSPPDNPQPPPSHHASRLFSSSGHQLTCPPRSTHTSRRQNVIHPEPDSTNNSGQMRYFTLQQGYWIT